jgi:hypothetical protein
LTKGVNVNANQNPNEIQAVELFAVIGELEVIRRRQAVELERSREVIKAMMQERGEGEEPREPDPDALMRQDRRSK